METQQTVDEPLPFAAPCRTLSPGAPLRWLRLGWRDFRAAPLPSIAFGIGVAFLSAIVCGIALRYGTGWLVLMLLSGFVFIAPVLAIGVYNISATLEQGRTPTLAGCMRATRRDLGDSLVYSLILMVICLVWVRAGSAVEIFFPDQSSPTGIMLTTFFAIGSAVGTIFALGAFAASAFSLPMLADRKSDAVTAVVTSVNAVLRNKRPMLVWALLIVLCVAAGFATALIGLVVSIPLIGFATWHAYRETIDASQWPAKE